MDCQTTAVREPDRAFFLCHPDRAQISDGIYRALIDVVNVPRGVWSRALRRTRRGPLLTVNKDIDISEAAVVAKLVLSRRYGRTIEVSV
jgi:hypothetical protein